MNMQNEIEERGVRAARNKLKSQIDFAVDLLREDIIDRAGLDVDNAVIEEDEDGWVVLKHHGCLATKWGERIEWTADGIHAVVVLSREQVEAESEANDGDQ